MKYIALLRGINVVGKNKIKMDSLRQVCSGLGFCHVKTYINSGNVIFETNESDTGKIVKMIESAIESQFALKIKTILRSTSEIEEIVQSNPFAGKFENHKELHVFFLDAPLTDDKCERLLSNNSEYEMFAVSGREIFHLTKIGFPDSLAGKDYLGKKLKVSATARNWRSVSNILELLRAESI